MTHMPLGACYGILDALRTSLADCILDDGGKDREDMRVCGLCLHFANGKVMQLPGWVLLSLISDTPAYNPNGEAVSRASSVISATMQATLRLPEDSSPAEMMSELAGLQHITCNTAIRGVCLHLWSRAPNAVGRRAFKVHACLNPVRDFSAEDSYVYSDCGDVMVYDTEDTEDVSFAFNGLDWTFSFYQHLQDTPCTM